MGCVGLGAFISKYLGLKCFEGSLDQEGMNMTHPSYHFQELLRVKNDALCLLLVSSATSARAERDTSQNAASGRVKVYNMKLLQCDYFIRLIPVFANLP